MKGLLQFGYFWKQTLRWRSACREFIIGCSEDWHLYKKMGGSRVGHTVKSVQVLANSWGSEPTMTLHTCFSWGSQPGLYTSVLPSLWIWAVSWGSILFSYCSSLQQRHFLKRSNNGELSSAVFPATVGINLAFPEEDFLAHYSIHSRGHLFPFPSLMSSSTWQPQSHMVLWVSPSSYG